MSRIKDFYNKYLSRINAYWLVTIVFLIVTFTVGDSSLYKRYTYDENTRFGERDQALPKGDRDQQQEIKRPSYGQGRDWNVSPVKSIS